MDVLNPLELQSATQIITKGLESGAKQLSFFMKEPIELAAMDMNWTTPVLLSPESDEPYYVLTTQIVGELTATCYFILTPTEADNLRQKALPIEVLQNAALYTELKDAILLEMDNILAASVVTQFANALRCKIHGSVPQLKRATTAELTALITPTTIQNMPNVLDFKVKFTAKDTTFMPLFVWFFNPSFVTAFKAYAAKI